VLREDRQATQPVSLPETIQESLDCLENDELLNKVLPKAMMRGYIALRRVDAERTAKMSLDDEVREALERS